jgi:Hemerythrin HHE cation binding domain
MLDMLRKLIGQPAKPAAAPAPAPLRSGAIPPPRAPSYDSGLVPSLKNDHQELVALFEQIGRTYEARRFHEIPALLTAFKTRLEAHLLTENVRFYNYVEATLRDDAENLSLIRDFRREMNTIARGVIDFVKKYQGQHVEQLQQSFLSDYRAVGGLLVQRIQREEGNLYPLYMPT